MGAMLEVDSNSMPCDIIVELTFIFDISAEEAYPVGSGTSICSSGVALAGPMTFLGLSRLMRSQ
jgi:hypothetical protein